MLTSWLGSPAVATFSTGRSSHAMLRCVTSFSRSLRTKLSYLPSATSSPSPSEARRRLLVSATADFTADPRVRPGQAWEARAAAPRRHTAGASGGVRVARVAQAGAAEASSVLITLQFSHPNIRKPSCTTASNAPGAAAASSAVSRTHRRPTCCTLRKRNRVWTRDSSTSEALLGLGGPQTSTTSMGAALCSSSVCQPISSWKASRTRDARPSAATTTSTCSDLIHARRAAGLQDCSATGS
mmetsp:Transcript_48853/g.129161  ORF Transcript_48853/g.129161 Transcript_48853/m.129161 type:complete len:241 (-) Transcript_48853:175-897(-)